MALKKFVVLKPKRSSDPRHGGRTFWKEVGTAQLDENGGRLYMHLLDEPLIIRPQSEKDKPHEDEVPPPDEYFGPPIRGLGNPEPQNKEDKNE